MTFRTPDEAVMLADNTRYGPAASVWERDHRAGARYRAEVEVVQVKDIWIPYGDW
jgi:acyl-CoA reductase-like NAD-dependent aldehyde dehydrogenase